MKRLTVLGAFALAAILFSSCETTTGSSSTVYLCTGGSSTKYHYTSSCQGLSNCGSAIISTTISDAQSQGRTLCGFE
jgi:dissimilatory sulfite reductase (desulfoviridin) alpha/beta subunit